ncbi:MAG: FMN-dependent NADH-azoreductase [Steroidobacteraceae bacterium]
MNLLHLDSSALGDFSASRELTRELAERLRAGHPGAKYRYRDLAAAPPAHVTGTLLGALRSQQPAAAELEPELNLTDELLREFLAADVVVVGAPMYNFSIPSTLKAWIDRVAQAGKTFRYTANGPEGLAGGKRVIIVSTRGSMMAGTPHEAAMDHQEAYLRTVFGFFGITDIEVLRAEGIGLGPEARSEALARAHQQVPRIAARGTEQRGVALAG